MLRFFRAVTVACAEFILGEKLGEVHIHLSPVFVVDGNIDEEDVAAAGALLADEVEHHLRRQSEES